LSDLTAFYLPAEGCFESTALTSGPWDPRLQHAGPPSALLARAAEDLLDPDWHLARFTVDLYRPAPVAPVRTRAELTRRGRRVCHSHVILTDLDGRELFAARGVHLHREPIAGLPTLQTAPPAVPPEDCPPLQLPFPPERVGYHTAMDVRRSIGRFRSGPVEAWFRMRVPLVAGTPTRPVERVLVAADAGSGISPVLDWSVYGFVNADLTVVLDRHLLGEWVGLDARTDLGPEGVGTTHAIVRDGGGRFGHSLQTLVLSRLGTVV
jgi:hypothetical protein